jgi:hypothetical protein
MRWRDYCHSLTFFSYIPLPLLLYSKFLSPPSKLPKSSGLFPLLPHQPLLEFLSILVMEPVRGESFYSVSLPQVQPGQLSLLCLLKENLLQLQL